ncbi:hypothetical protein L1D16_20945 [Vibrio sp. Isolate31]|uniref:hypothetical protein n=1 Tax=unclassified Vibrio TaxID=2614977 RepID=UPI001EFD8B85|nr:MULTISPECIES: hypothetical protein [unclassified Vibrio]MCG9553912.1 hypothetical protein [Vibrio sp. Isolate32]MCG9603204.1 hypothetical protein [Vibrio sp. Isolate31]
MPLKTMTLMVLFFTSLSQASTIDNDEPLLNSLIEKGVICPGLSYEDNQEALRIYLNAKAQKSHQFDSKKYKEIENKRQKNKTPTECINPNRTIEPNKAS